MRSGLLFRKCDAYVCRSSPPVCVPDDAQRRVHRERREELHPAQVRRLIPGCDQLLDREPVVAALAVRRLRTIGGDRVEPPRGLVWGVTTDARRRVRGTDSPIV
jgi:hypothetical protein